MTGGSTIVGYKSPTLLGVTIMAIGTILRVLRDGSADRVDPTTCDSCSKSVADPTAWERETYTGYGAAVLDVCPHCESAVRTYYGPS